MGMPYSETCCCGVSLKYGAIATGCFDVIIAILLIILAAITIDQKLQNDPDQTGLALYEISIVFILINALLILASIVLIVGAVTETAKLLIPYLICVTVHLIFHITFTVVKDQDYSPGINAAYYVVSIVVVLPTHVNTFVATYSLYKRLTSPNAVLSGNQLTFKCF